MLTGIYDRIPAITQEYTEMKKAALFSLKCSLCRKHALCFPVDLNTHAQGSAESLENGFKDMVGVAAVLEVYVQVHACCV